MINHLKYYIIICFLLINIIGKTQVKIGSNHENINKFSLLELESSDKAFVLPRLNSIQMGLIEPLPGALIYNTDSKCVHQYDGIHWTSLCDAFSYTETTTVLTDNKDGTFTYLNEDNDSVKIEKAKLIDNGDNTFTFTNSDFGRTLTSNGDGSDHAWGGHQIIMGGAVDGGKVYGTYPRLTPDDPQFLNRRGALVPSTSMDQMSATIAKWFGDFTDGQLLELFPNLANYNVRDLGFFK